MILTQTVFFIIGFRVFFSFEIRAVREFENFHYGWYCSLSVDAGNNLKSSVPQNFYNEQFENVFLTSEEIDEIRNEINDLLYMEDEPDEKTQNTDFEKNPVTTDNPDDS